MNKRKYIAIIVMVLTSMILLNGCSLIIKEKEKIEDKEFINIISIDEIIDKIENKESFNFIFGSENCPSCSYYKEELGKFHKDENYKFDYFNYNDSVDKDRLLELIKMLDENEETLATPITYFIQEGLLIEKAVGALTVNEIKDYSEYYK